MINIKNLIIVVFLVFGVQTIAFTEPSPKQVTIRSKFIAGSKKGERFFQHLRLLLFLDNPHRLVLRPQSLN